jgi:nitroreductase
MENIFTERRSVKYFDKDKKLDKELLEKIINTATLAPSAYNLQPWRLIACESDEAKERLYNVARKQQKILDASVVLIVVADYEGYKLHNPVWEKKALDDEEMQRRQEKYKKAYEDNEKRRIKFGEVNAGIFVMSILLAAKYYGVDSHPMGGMSYEGVKEEFHLAQHEEPALLIALGYADPNETLHDREWRKQYDDIVETI